jgi:hypothetical protein
LFFAFLNDVRIIKDEGVIGAIGDRAHPSGPSSFAATTLFSKPCEAMSLLLVTGYFQSYFYHLTLFDILAIVLTMVAVVNHE